MKRLTFVYFGVLYAALACALTWPLVRHLTTTVPHDVGDPLLSTVLLWWNANVTPLTARWWDGVGFWPAAGSIAFSDHRLGESVIASPLQWLGANPVTAYNVVLLATYPLSALAAHWLAFVLTKRHDAGAIAGLSYGFCPFRAAHLPHLELLAAFGMPAALAAMHRYRDTRQPWWLAIIALALFVQGLCSSYYIVFFLVLLGLWLLWFAHRDDIETTVGIVAAGALAVAGLAPLAKGYARIHDMYGFARPFEEILRYSADVTSLLTAHSSVMLWGWTARWSRPETELFPGAAIAIVTLIGVTVVWRRHAGARDRIDRASTLLIPVAIVAAALAFAAWMYAPWHIDAAGIRVSSDAPFKPMTIALLAIAAWLAASSRMRGAYARRSALAFYAIATLALFLCTLGPKPTFAGHQFLYEPPYAWLMRLPVFGLIRVPSRFALPAMLALATTGALAFDQLRLSSSTRRAFGVAVMIAIVADGWMWPVALPALPEAWPPSHATRAAAVIELPLGELMGDIAATYRATVHQHPVVNGSSGFEPPYYQALRLALREHDASVVDALASHGTLLAVVDAQADPDGTERRWIESLGTREPDAASGWSFFTIAQKPAPPALCRGGDRLTPVAARAGDAAIDLAPLVDGDRDTFWVTGRPQRPGETLTLDLGHAARPCRAGISLGAHPELFPRRLRVDVSADGEAWTPVFEGRTAGMAVMAAIVQPLDAWLEFPLPAPPARYIRFTLLDAHPTIEWIVTDVAVYGAR